MTEPIDTPELIAEVKFRIWALDTPLKMARCAADCVKLGRNATMFGWWGPDNIEKWSLEVSSGDPSHPTQATSNMKIVQQGSRIEAVTDEEIIDRYGQSALNQANQQL